MTQFLTLTPNKDKSATAPASPDTFGEAPDANRLLASLSASGERHASFEIASFHTPGHKGRALSPGFAKLAQRLLQSDLTELPGLDDLSSPSGVIAHLEGRAANLWGSATALISMGGASLGLAAALLALSANSARKKVLVPRNAHRSIVHGLILSGLEPVWFEPVWDANWGIWGGVSPTSVDKLLASAQTAQCAALFLVSPTYAGAVSDIAAIAEKCHQSSLALIVDEAHGAHFLPAFGRPSPAVDHADVTVHSLSKTLCGLTSTGLVHVHRHSRIAPALLRAALNLLTTSSPSYPLMMSVEQTISFLETEPGRARLATMAELCGNLAERLGAEPSVQVYRAHAGNDPAHVLLRPTGFCADQLQQVLIKERIFCETLLGNGLLLLLGLGSQSEDIERLTEVFNGIDGAGDASGCRQTVAHPAAFADGQQVMTPRQAFLMPSEVVPIEQAIGRIAHECVAPCPPGIPVSIPGQRVHREVMNIESLRSLRVVKESQ